MSANSAKIAELNDLLRTTFLSGKVVLTQGIASLEPDVREAVLSAVRAFSSFGPENDPYGERDFGSLVIENVGRVFWKIDYFAIGYRTRSPDPWDAANTRRVLTIMLAEEY